MWNIPEVLCAIANRIHQNGGRALLVGGCVRDMLLGIEPKDFDVEVYEIESDILLNIAKEFGTVSNVGEAFGILKLQIPNEREIDLSLPRHDAKIASGHKGFAVHTDPFMSVRDAARRRDFTVNAILFDPLTNEILDPYNGREDLKNGILRVVDTETFGDDPLRVLRGMQFAARFSLTPDRKSFAVMQNAVGRMSELSKERFKSEWEKLLVLSEKPSIGLALGFDLGVFTALHPEIPPLKETPQNPAWHPEGDAWIHTLMVVDEAAKIIRREQHVADDAFMIMLAAFTHDFGKPLCTKMIDGVWRSIGHEDAGEIPTRTFLKSIGVNATMTEKIVGIVKDHLKPTKYYLDDVEKGTHISDGAIRKLAARIFPATIEELLLVSEADYFGRGLFRHGAERTYPERAWLLKRAEAINVVNSPPEHAVTGKELIALGIPSGPKVGEIICEADRMRDDEGKTKEEILAWIQNELRWI